MITARDTITGALRLINVIGDAEEPTGTQLQTGLFSLQEMIDHWNADDQKIFTTSFFTCPVIGGKQFYTVGPGADIDVSVRPASIHSAAVTYTNNSSLPVDLPLTILNPNEWLAIRSKQSPSVIPRFIFLDGNFPIANLYVWPLPNSSSTLNLTLNMPLGLLEVDSAISLPPSYRMALRFNLAVALAPEYGQEASPTVQAKAIDSMRILQSNNLNINRLQTDVSLAGGRYHIGSDSFISR